jgi:hypothetical protein
MTVVFIILIASHNDMLSPWYKKQISEKNCFSMGYSAGQK